VVENLVMERSVVFLHPVVARNRSKIKTHSI
jgi:hypothetical protein